MYYNEYKAGDIFSIAKTRTVSFQSCFIGPLKIMSIINSNNIINKTKPPKTIILNYTNTNAVLPTRINMSSSVAVNSLPFIIVLSPFEIIFIKPGTILEPKGKKTICAVVITCKIKGGRNSFTAQRSPQRKFKGWYSG